MTMSSESNCDYCGLPVPSGSSSQNDEAPKYCCFGCRFASAVTRENGREGELRWTLTRLGVAVFFTMNVMVFSMTLWTQDLYEVDAAQPLAGSFRDLLRYLCLVFSLPVLFLLGRPILENAIEQLRCRVWSTDLLLMTGVVASFLYSALALFRGSAHVYFEVGCMVLVMVTLGRWLEALGRHRANHALDELERLLPAETRVVDPDGNCRSVPRGQIAVGQTIRVVTGGRVPLDGVVSTGLATLDEQLLTGEAVPVEKTVDNPVWAGTLSVGGSIDICVSAASTDGALMRLTELVREARSRHGRYCRLADRVASWFFPVVFVVAVLTLVVHSWTDDPASGIMAAMSVVLIACPCALGLATPLAVWTALGTAAGRQVLFRSGETLERLSEIQSICFDKTGTLTTGKLACESVGVMQSRELPIVLELTRQLTRHSSHPFSLSLSEQLSEFSVHEPMLPVVLTGDPEVASSDSSETRDALDSFSMLTPTLRIESPNEEPGLGIRAFAESEPVMLGSERFLVSHGFEFTEEMNQFIADAVSLGRSVVSLGWRARVVAVFVLSETLRSESRDALTDLCRAGLETHVLTGDSQVRAQSLSRELSVDVEGELLPDGKLKVLEELSVSNGPVAMVGDGVNDAPALAASHLGIAMGCGSDISRDAADVCLLSNDLSRLPWVLDLSRKTTRIVRQNLGWAFGYNSVGILLAACGWLNPVFAAIVMIGSSVIVIGNSLRLASSDSPDGLNEGGPSNEPPAGMPRDGDFDLDQVQPLAEVGN